MFPPHVPPEYADLIRDYCREFFVSKGMIADFAIHDKDTPILAASTEIG